MSDAVVIGAGPNGLVAANLLADAGWEVLVLEAEDTPGGAVKSSELIEPGFTSDHFSAFYPLSVASPIIKGFELERFGLAWKTAPLVLAHPDPSGACPFISTDIDETASSLDDVSPGDGDAWRRLYGLWEEVGPEFIKTLFTPFPPIAPPLRLAAKLGPRELSRFARFVTLPVRRLAEETFVGPGGGMLLAGNALHSDLSPESVMSGFYGWFLSCLGQELGFPVPEGGAGSLTAALVARLESKGGRVECGQRVERIHVERGRAVAVTSTNGGTFGARRAVLADVGAPQLFLDLVGEEHLPSRVKDDLEKFHYDNGTVKVDWALRGPIPWKAEPARRAGTVHIADSMDQLTEFSAQLSMGQIPAKPFLVLGQMTTADATRSPSGTESAWAYAHVPQHSKGDALGQMTGKWDEVDTEIFAARMEEQVEALAPGFKDLVIGRHVMNPGDLEKRNANLVAGAINGGTAQLHQTLIFRPTTGLARPETPIKDLYLASASAHPGGGVHGAPGANAAKAALWRERRKKMILPLGGAALVGALLRRRD